MLAQFRMVRQFNKLRVVLWVDCENKESSMCVSYERRLIRPDEAIPFHLTRTPELAEAWLSTPIGERGSRIETMEWSARNHIYA